MPRVAPARPRSTLTTIPGGIRVVIPSRRHWSVVPFLSLWLVGWAFGEVMAIRQLFQGPTPGPAALFLIAWLATWTFGGALVFASILWATAGREVVSVTGRTLAVRREALGVGRTWEYDAGHVRNVHVVPVQDAGPFGSSAAALSFWRFKGGTIAFDYGARTLRFGAGVDEAEATPIVVAIRERLPSGA